MNVMSKAPAAPVEALAAQVVPPQPRQYQGMNWTGLKTLYLKEVRRFWKVGTQTVAAPVVTTLLYMMIFVIAMSGTDVHNQARTGAFIGPGLIMMAILNNAFANSSSSLIQAKIMGTAPDFLTPPLSPIELMLGFGLGAATRGIVVGLVTAAAVWPFSHFGLEHAWAIAFYGVCASLIMGFVGVIGGLWSEKFDQLAAVTNFIITPLTFLSGTFYRVDRLPPFFQELIRFNPMFYMIDGFRFGFIGQADGDMRIGAAYVLALLVVLAGVAYGLFKSGWRLKT
jgi:ABC-2 type transport system permease protein